MGQASLMPIGTRFVIISPASECSSDKRERKIEYEVIAWVVTETKEIREEVKVISYSIIE